MRSRKLVAMGGGTDWLKGSAIAVSCFLLSSLVGEAVFLISDKAGYHPQIGSDFLRLLPLNLVASVVALWVQSMGSAGLFAMALTPGEPTLRDFKVKPIARKMVWLALVGAILINLFVALFLLLVPGIGASLALPFAEWLASPFYCFAVVFMLERDLGVSGALLENFRVSRGRYLSLLRTVFLAAVKGGWGILLLGLGILWTLPNYHRTIVEAYRALSSSEAPSRQSERH